jgi:hypothetical protein
MASTIEGSGRCDIFDFHTSSTLRMRERDAQRLPDTIYVMQIRGQRVEREDLCSFNAAALTIQHPPRLSYENACLRVLRSMTADFPRCRGRRAGSDNDSQLWTIV